MKACIKLDLPVNTKLDFTWGFWQIRNDPNSIFKTAFNTRDGEYEFLVMSFWIDQCVGYLLNINEQYLQEAQRLLYSLF